MTSNLNAAVIGTGAISTEHLSFLSTYSNANLVAVCDLSEISASYAAGRFHAQSSFTDHNKMLADISPDIVHILTPPHTHKAIITDCLNAGSHVICEKPLALSNSDFEELWKLSCENNKVLIEDQNYRFNQPILEIHELIERSVLGDVQEVDIHIVLDIRGAGRFADEDLPNPVHKLPGGVIHDFITHMSYLTLCFLPNLELSRISAHWSNHGGGDLFSYDDLDVLIIDGSRHARMRFSCHTLPEMFQITVRGSKGIAVTDLFQPYIRCDYRRKTGKQFSPLANQFINGWGLIRASFRNFRNKIMQRTPYQGLERFLEHTYEAVRLGGKPPVGYKEMSQTIQLVDAVLDPRNRR